MTDSFQSLRLNTFGSIVYPRAATLGPRARDQFEVVWAQSGRFDVMVDGRRTAVGGNSLLFLKPGQTSLFEFGRHAPTRHGYFTFRLLDDGEYGVALAYPDTLSGSGSGLYVPLLDRLLDVLPSLPNCPAKDLWHLHETLSLFMESWSWLALNTEVSATVRSAALERALRHVHQSWRNGYEARMRVTDLAAAAGVTTRQLNRLFDAAYQMSTREYLRRERLAHGARLLERSNLSVQEISSACGFQSEFAFSRAFKAIYAAAPTVYRNSTND